VITLRTLRSSLLFFARKGSIFLLEKHEDNEYPNLVEFLAEHVMKPGYDYGDEFEYGLDLILDGLEVARQTA
jgi:hypothetical protein